MFATTSQPLAVSQSLIDAMGESAAIMDPYGTIQQTNWHWDEFARLSGARPEQVGPGVSYLQLLESSNDRESARIVAALEEVLAGRLERFDLISLCDTPDGERWFRQLMEPIWQDGAIRGVLLRFREITGHQAARRALSETLQEVEHLRSTALPGQALLPAFVRGLEHQVRDPFRLLRDDLKELEVRLSDGVHRPLALRALRRMMELESLLENILEQGRTVAGEEQLTPGPVHLGEMLAEVRRLLCHNSCANAECELLDARCIELAIAPDVPAWVQLDRQRTQHLLWNILRLMARWRGNANLRVELGVRRHEGREWLEFRLCCGCPGDANAAMVGRPLEICLEVARAMGGYLESLEASEDGSGVRLRLPLEHASGALCEDCHRILEERGLACQWDMPAFDLQLFREVVDDDFVLGRQMLEMFRSRYRVLMQELVGHLSGSSINWTLCADIAHNLKGTGSSMGARRLAAGFAALYELCKEQNESEVRALMPFFDQEWVQYCEMANDSIDIDGRGRRLGAAPLFSDNPVRR